MKLKNCFVTIVLLLFFASVAHSMEVGDVTIADTFMAGNTPLILNGAGFRSKMFINGISRAVIAGLDFKKALFGIWLCDQPADKNLKKKLLGL